MLIDVRTDRFFFDPFRGVLVLAKLVIKESPWVNGDPMIRSNGSGG